MNKEYVHTFCAFVCVLCIRHFQASHFLFHCASSSLCTRAPPFLFSAFGCVCLFFSFRFGVDGAVGAVLFKQFDEGKNVLTKDNFATLATFIKVNSVPLIVSASSLLLLLVLLLLFVVTLLLPVIMGLFSLLSSPLLLFPSLTQPPVSLFPSFPFFTANSLYITHLHTRTHRTRLDLRTTRHTLRLVCLWLTCLWT